MKKVTKILLAFVLGIAMSVNAMAQTATQPTGSGTETDPYQIATLDNLYWVTQNIASWGSYFVQTADIDASSTNTWDSGDGFSPIGDYTNNFTGSYDGGFHYIDGLYLNRTAEALQAMFGMVSGATINKIELTDCNITGQNYIGGIVGWSAGSLSTIAYCYASGDVTGENYVGGLVGSAVSLDVFNSYSLCDVTSVYENGYVGGLLGYSNATVENCYSAGLVTADNASTSNYGGLIGDGTSAFLMHCYWDTETSNQLTSSGGGFGLATPEMKEQGNFDMWDFDHIWLIDEMISYPYLNTTPPSPSVPVSDWALYLGILLMGTFMVVRYRNMRLV